jgi:hypothetical protein
MDTLVEWAGGCRATGGALHAPAGTGAPPAPTVTEARGCTAEGRTEKEETVEGTATVYGPYCRGSPAAYVPKVGVIEPSLIARAASRVLAE